jgi:5-formyltetrahydrofolate cyclo-ligase
LEAAGKAGSSMPRPALRRGLLERRAAFDASPDAVPAAVALIGHLAAVLEQLEPERLGVYWPHRSEFNAASALQADPRFARLPLALPFARRTPREMDFRAWNGRAPTLVDECGIAASDGVVVVPDVVLAPCVGFTADGFRLGYGGGYFDRWLAGHPETTAVGVAWSFAELDRGAFEAEPHDLPLAVIVTERGVR